jgi:hypothetical protein
MLQLPPLLRARNPEIDPYDHGSSFGIISDALEFIDIVTIVTITIVTIVTIMSTYNINELEVDQ